MSGIGPGDLGSSRRGAALQNNPSLGEQGLAQRSASLEESIRYQLYASGERERLKRLLTERLTDCGWKENVKELCKEYVQRHGRENVTTEEVVAAVRPAGRQTVPDAVKAQLLAEIKQFILKL